MSEKAAHVTGRVAHIIWSNEDTLIGVLNLFNEDGETQGSTKFKGFMPQVFKGDKVTLHGKWYEHPTFGKQVDVQWFEFAEPGECDEEQLKIADACQFIFKELEMEKRGERIFAALKGKAREVITANPYALADIPQIGFQTAEKIARTIGVDEYDSRRLEAKIDEIIKKASYDFGHHYVKWGRLIETASEALQLDYDFVMETVDRLTHPGQDVFGDPKPPALVIESESDTEDKIVYPYYLRVAECRLAEKVALLLRDREPAKSIQYKREELFSLQQDDAPSLELSDEQVDAVETSLKNTISIITGGPGVGKTTIIKKIVQVCVRNGLDVSLCSFTGRAARRLREATGRAAYTIHQLLGYNPRTRQFNIGPKDPLASDVLICDETSMVNLYIGSKLLDAVKDGTRVILVGDADQLPPIGPGAVFRELINSGVVPVARLEHIFRQAAQSRIIRESRRVLEKTAPVTGNIEDREDFYVFTYRSSASGLSQILKLVSEKIPEQFGIPSEDIQILAPIYKGDVGIHRLNTELQRILRGKVSDGEKFVPGDKVIFTKNDHDIGVMNGDVGIVQRILRKSIDVVIDKIEYRFDQSQMRHLELAYAISIHKSQGSEYPATITVVSPGGPPGFFNRNMLYTAMTRGKKLSIIVTPAGNSVLQVVVSTGERKRNSKLTQRIKEISVLDEIGRTEDAWDLKIQQQVL